MKATYHPVLTSVRTIAALDGPPCQADLYAPFYFQEPELVASGFQELLLTQGDYITRLCYPPADPRFPFCDRNRGSDRIRLFVKPPGFDWRSVDLDAHAAPGSENLLLTNHSAFPWMGDLFHGDRLVDAAEAYLRANLDTYIGATASPSMFRIGSAYHRIFAATVGDSGFNPARIDDAEYMQTRAFSAHGAFRNTVTTSRQFALFWNTSDNALTVGKLRNMKREHPNLAIQHALLWFGSPSAAESYPAEQGITSACAYLADSGLYVAFQVSSPYFGGSKNGIVRIVSGLGGEDMRLWDGAGWEPVVNGELPEWFLRSQWAGNPYQHIISWIGEAPYGAPGNHMLIAPGAGFQFGGRGRDNVIEVAYSDDLVRWNEPQMVESRIPGFLDGTGADYQCRNPAKSAYGFVVATNDLGIIESNPSKYGTAGCQNEFGGLRIVEVQ